MPPHTVACLGHNGLSTGASDGPDTGTPRPSTSTVPVVPVADLLAQLGAVPASRVHPEPGTAKEADGLAVSGRAKRLCELVDRILVAQTVEYYKSYLAAMLIRLLENFVVQHDLGLVAGADGMLRLAPGLARW